MADDAMEKIVSLCKRRGFIYQGSEIYGGLAGTWDYGPFGVELKNNIKQLWWRMFVQDRDDMVGVDAAILMNPKVWEASGHVSGFSDPLVECKNCRSRFRADHLIEEVDKFENYRNKIQQSFTQFWNEESVTELDGMYKEIANSRFISFLADAGFSDRDAELLADFFSTWFNDLISGQSVDVDFDHRTGQIVGAGSSLSKDLSTFLVDMKSFNDIATTLYLNNEVKCPSCGKFAWSAPRQFNMMFKTEIGAQAGSISYLRPETAGGIFVNFKNVVDSIHPKLPFGIAQIGKAFRNEIAPRDFIFRVRELEQMEIEYFVRPSEWEEGFESWRQLVHAFIDAVGIAKESVHELEVAAEDRAHYSKRTIDFEFDFPFGRKELFGLAYRGDFDLSSHENGSKVNLGMQDKEGEPAFKPHVIEPSFGVERTMLAIIASAYTEDSLGGETRTYLKFNKSIAPIKAAVFPLLKNKPELIEKAREVYLMLKKQVPQIMWDDNGNIGKRYRRQDEIGTPICITIDFDTLGENPSLKDTVTVRDRDTGGQKRVAIGELTQMIS